MTGPVDGAPYVSFLGRDLTSGKDRPPSTAALHKGEGNKPYTVRLNPEQLAAAQRWVEQLGVPVAEVLRLGLTALDLLDAAQLAREIRA